MPASRSEVAARRAALKLRAKGSPITLRMVTFSAGAEPLPNPPGWEAVAVAGAHLAGATSLALAGTRLLGRLVAGDRLTIGADTVTVAAEASAEDNAITVTLAAPGLPADVADGAAVTPIWSADLPIMAEVAAGPRRLPDGSMTESRSFTAKIARFDLPDGVNVPDKDEPSHQWRIIMADGDERTVIDIAPTMVNGVCAVYDLLAR